MKVMCDRNELQRSANNSLDCRMIKIIHIIIGFTFLPIYAFAQENAESNTSFWRRMFLPSIDVGYQVPNSDLIGGSVRIGTSIEYRIKNNNDFFLRINYDTYSANYKLSNTTSLTNTIEGSVQFTDVVSGLGYRFGDKTYRLMVAALPGVKLYEFPTASVEEQQIVLKSTGKSVFTTIFLSTLEYYVDEKSALTFSLYQNQVWNKTDFWQNGSAAIGFSIGFITSLL